MIASAGLPPGHSTRLLLCNSARLSKRATAACGRHPCGRHTSVTNDGRPRRWIVVRPGDGQTGILLARADGEHQPSFMGQQFAGRVGLFPREDDFDTAFQRMIIRHDYQ